MGSSGLIQHRCTAKQGLHLCSSGQGWCSGIYVINLLLLLITERTLQHCKTQSLLKEERRLNFNEVENNWSWFAHYCNNYNLSSFIITVVTFSFPFLALFILAQPPGLTPPPFFLKGWVPEIHTHITPPPPYAGEDGACFCS